MPLPHSVLFTCSKHLRKWQIHFTTENIDSFFHKIIIKLGTILADISKGAYIISKDFIYTEYKFSIYLYIYLYIGKNLRSKFVVI